MKSLRDFFISFIGFVNLLLLKLNNVDYGSNLIVNGFLVLKNNGFIKIGDQVKINSSRFFNIIGGETRSTLIVNKDAKLVIGDRVKISNAAFYANSSITIEDDVMIGGGCKIWDTDFHPIDPKARLETPNDNFSSKPILIKENAFIGGGSTILKGVTVGKNSVLGAESVLTRSIPDNEIWAGNPAKFIKEISSK